MLVNGFTPSPNKTYKNNVTLKKTSHHHTSHLKIYRYICRWKSVGNGQYLIFLYDFIANNAKMEERRSISKEQIIMAYVATCIETTARYLKTDYKNVFERMERVGMIDKYILPNYEPLHSESRDVLAERLVECLTNWEEQA